MNLLRSAYQLRNKASLLLHRPFVKQPVLMKRCPGLNHCPEMIAPTIPIIQYIIYYVYYIIGVFMRKDLIFRLVADHEVLLLDFGEISLR